MHITTKFWKLSEIVRCLKYSLEVLYGKLYGTKLYIFLYIICEKLSASRIRHIGLENLKNYCRSFSSSRAQKRCAPGDTAPLSHSHGLLHKFVKGSVTARTVYVRSRAFCGYGGNLFNLIKIMTKKLGLMHKMHDIQFKV